MGKIRVLNLLSLWIVNTLELQGFDDLEYMSPNIVVYFLFSLVSVVYYKPSFFKYCIGSFKGMEINSAFVPISLWRNRREREYVNNHSYRFFPDPWNFWYNLKIHRL